MHMEKKRTREMAENLPDPHRPPPCLGSMEAQDLARRADFSLLAERGAQTASERVCIEAAELSLHTRSPAWHSWSFISAGL